jgi:hypothetical protein
LLRCKAHANSFPYAETSCTSWNVPGNNSADQEHCVPGRPAWGISRRTISLKKLANLRREVARRRAIVIRNLEMRANKRFGNVGCQ